ncbi:MAG: hypothetical protein V2B18_02545 [Pseudomonadota bacterium]
MRKTDYNSGLNRFRRFSPGNGRPTGVNASVNPPYDLPPMAHVENLREVSADGPDREGAYLLFGLGVMNRGRYSCENRMFKLDEDNTMPLLKSPRPSEAGVRYGPVLST